MYHAAHSTGNEFARFGRTLLRSLPVRRRGVDFPCARRGTLLFGAAADRRHITRRDRETAGRNNWPRGKELLTRAFKMKTRDEWCKLLEGTDACFAPVLSMAEAPLHAHIEARNTFIEVGGITQPAPAPRFRVALLRTSRRRRRHRTPTARSKAGSRQKRFAPSKARVSCRRRLILRRPRAEGEELEVVSPLAVSARAE